MNEPGSRRIWLDEDLTLSSIVPTVRIAWSSTALLPSTYFPINGSVWICMGLYGSIGLSFLLSLFPSNLYTSSLRCCWDSSILF